MTPHRHFWGPRGRHSNGPQVGTEKDPPHGARFVRANNEPREGGQISDGHEDIAHGTTGHRPTTENEPVDQGDQTRDRQASEGDPQGTGTRRAKRDGWTPSESCHRSTDSRKCITSSATARMAGATRSTLTATRSRDGTGKATAYHDTRPLRLRGADKAVCSGDSKVKNR